ncbi:ankyrin repeat-containing domain protein [Peziza echinospora]|nr:ankyrin repeat-containing domain protein [Peziza echinospora]
MAPLTEDHIDDILYLARIGDVTELLVLLTELREAGITTPSGGNTNKEYILAAKDEDGNTAIHMASANGHTGIVTTFLPQSSKSEATTTTSTAPTESSSSSSTPTQPPHILTTPQNTAGNTPLHWASVNGHLSTVKALVELGNADATVQNKAGRDPVFEAELADHGDVVDWLLRSCGELEVAIGAGERGKGGDDSSDEEEEEKKEKAVEGKGKGKKEVAVVDAVSKGVESLEVR